jgi:hypothetical protein
MRKKILALLACAAMAFVLVACKDKAETPLPHPAGGPPPGVVMPPGETKVVVPDEVKDQWGAVTLVIEDKVANKTEEVDIKLGNSYAVPNSKLKLDVGEFLPDFKMNGATITSSSNEMNNPAVNVTVTEGDTEIFSGWLYSKFPAIHPFQHEKYGLTLKGAKKEG